MRLFLLHLAIFTGSVLLVFEGIKASGAHRRWLPGDEVYRSLDQSARTWPVTTVVLGDSVAKQIFDNASEHAGFVSLACNQAVSLAGHYVLLRRYLDANPQTRRVILIYSPFTLSADLRDRFTYNYFCKPFSEAACRQWATPLVRERLAALPGAGVARFAPVLTTTWCPRVADPRDPPPLSEVAVEHLALMAELARGRGCTFTVVPAPIRASRRGDWRRVAAAFVAWPAVAAILGDYAAQVEMLPDADFIDHVHLTAAALVAVRERLRDRFFPVADR